MNKEYGVYTAIAAVIIVLGAGIWWVRLNPSSNPTPAQTATSTDSGLSSTTSSTPGSTAAPTTPSQPVAQSQPKPATSSSPTAYQFALVPGEVVTSWTFAGSYKDGGKLEASRYAEILRLLGMLNSGTFTNYELYVSIANQYELLGDGKQEFTYLNYALAIDSEHTGLAWHNMGKLLERFGAYKTARVAYDRMVQAQKTTQYITVRLEFLKAHMPEDTEAIAQAEADLKTSTW